MIFDDYIREIELIIKQNFVEQDLYSIIACLIREKVNFKSLSLRDVSNRRRTMSRYGLEKVFYGIGGFPDFVILSEKFSGDSPCKKNILGAIEAKYIGCPLKDIKDNIQLKGHILWFNKVLYTNGLEWQYYNYDAKKGSIIEQIQNDIYYWRKKEKYPWSSNELSLLGSINMLKPQWSISLTSENKDGNAMNWDKNQWIELQKNISEIIW